DSITFKDVNGTAQTFTVEQLSKRDYLNDVTGNSDLIVLLAYGKNEVPLVPNANSPGYNADVNNSDGPFRLIVGQTEAGEFNSSRCMGEIKEIIVEAQAGDSWKHDHGDFTQYQDQAVLRVTGSQVTAPRTFSLKQLEALDQHIIRNIYLGDQEVEGVILWNLIKDVVGLKDGVTEPSSIRVFAGANYNQITNTSQVINGVVNSQGVTKDILAGYAVNSYPLVPESSSPGYINNNQYGPLRLIVEENGSMWIKWLDCIVVGDGTYEAPLAQDIIQDEPEGPAVFTVSGSGVSGAQDYTLEQLQGMEATTSQYSYTAGGELITDTCTGVPLADLLAGLGISDPDWELNITSTDGYDYGTVTLQDIVDQNYLLAYSVNGSSFEDTKEGYPSSSIRIYRNFNDGSNWRNRLTLVRGVEVTSTTPVLITPVERDWAFYRNDDGSGLPLAGVRCITPDGNGGIWVGTNGGGAAYRNAGGTWTVYNKDNSALPHNSIYAIAVDETGGVWFAGGSPSDGMGIVYKKGDQWTVYTTENSNIPHDFAWSIALDNRGGAWFGTGAGPVYRDSEGNWTPRNNESFPAKSVSAIALDAQGGVWFGFCPETSTGESPGGYAYMNPQGEVTSYAETSTVTGGKWVRSISIDKDGGVWIARYGKVDYISASGERTIYETDADLLPFLTEGDSIRQVIADQEGGLWISTSASGLYYRNQAGEFMNYNAANTWPTAQFNSVWSVNSCQNGELWIGTNGGAAGIATPQSDDHPVYTIAPLSDSVYTAGTTADGINTMTVNTGITGFKYFTVNITPVDSHSGNETVVFTHSRNGTQLAINATRADFDTVQTAQSGFNVQAGDVIKAYIVDDLTNAADLNPVVFQ
ncbi:MAG: two-component regulator propeller domain-containing protein, partial [Syntrophomonas sp.]